MGYNVELIKKVFDENITGAEKIIESALGVDLNRLSCRCDEDILHCLGFGMRKLQKNPNDYIGLGDYDLALNLVTKLFDCYLEYKNMIMHVNGLRVVLEYIVEEVGSYTYNVSSMYKKAMGGTLNVFYGMIGQEMISILEKGIEEMESNREEYKELNPNNGWGNYDDALKFLKDILNACKENPDAIFTI